MKNILLYQIGTILFVALNFSYSKAQNKCFDYFDENNLIYSSEYVPLSKNEVDYIYFSLVNQESFDLLTSVAKITITTGTNYVTKKEVSKLKILSNNLKNLNQLNIVFTSEHEKTKTISDLRSTILKLTDSIENKDEANARIIATELLNKYENISVEVIVNNVKFLSKISAQKFFIETVKNLYKSLTKKTTSIDELTEIKHHLLIVLRHFQSQNYISNLTKTTTEDSKLYFQKNLDTSIDTQLILNLKHLLIEVNKQINSLIENDQREEKQFDWPKKLRQKIIGTMSDAKLF